MSKAGRRGMREALRRDRSYVVHLGYTNGKHTSIVFEPTRGSNAQAAASEWTAKKIAEHRDELRWVTVFEPYFTYGRVNEQSKVHKWSPRSGWTTMTRTAYNEQKQQRRAAR